MLFLSYSNGLYMYTQWFLNSCIRGGWKFVLKGFILSILGPLFFSYLNVKIDMLFYFLEDIQMFEVEMLLCRGLTKLLILKINKTY